MYTHYYGAGVVYSLTPKQVAAIVRKHNLPKRKILGSMAVDSDAWDKTMQETHQPITAKGYKKL